MHNGDVLGDEGRKALDACVKVTIVGKPETRRYDRDTALRRLQGCYDTGYIMDGFWPIGCLSRFRPHVMLRAESGNHRERTYNIVDINNELVKFDNMNYIEKYPKEGPGSDKLRDLIDKRRADVERELEEARTDPDGRHRYSWIVAQRRVRDCYAGNFLGDRALLKEQKEGKPCNIIDIHNAVDFCDQMTFHFQRAEVEKEHQCAEAIVSGDKNIQYTFSQKEAEEHVRRSICFSGRSYLYPSLANILPVKMDDNGKPKLTQTYDISEINKVLAYFGGKKMLDKYPEEGPGSDELKKLIDAHRDDLNKEYQQATCDAGSATGYTGKTSLLEYSWHEAERRVRDCFAGSVLEKTDIFPTKKDQSGTPKIFQTFDIFDIKDALDHFDTRTLYKKYPEEGPEYYKIKQLVDERRAGIQSEYITATTNIEIEHGSGFIIHDHFIITNKHVIETYLDEKENYEIHISNAAIDDLPCKVAHHDVGKDLALLYCPELNVKQSGICPLQLSNQSLLPGMSIFSFGYPMSHTGETALFVNGNVSGSKETLAGHSMVVLNCSLNSGNSGGPVLCWVNGQLKVVGVATQKHFKQILSFEERETIEKIRKSLQTHTIPDAIPEYVETLPLTVHDLHSRPCRNSMFLLTLKLYDALETHSQFNLSNALPGHLVIEFIKNSISEYTGDDKEELPEIVKLSHNDSVNTLPSDGPLSALFKSAINIIFRYR